ncbi:hypothetical protein SBBP1_350014 [Burkholderiales bacterium]|nr:hypothetical protein SBBP1_350014 [Burkholderiales bacterium]
MLAKSSEFLDQSPARVLCRGRQGPAPRDACAPAHGVLLPGRDLRKRAPRAAPATPQIAALLPCNSGYWPGSPSNCVISRR